MYPQVPWSWLTARLRSSPDFELVPLERLNRAEGERLLELDSSSDLYGLLQPRRNGQKKIVHRDLALLWLTLREEGIFPHFARQGRSVVEIERELTAWVADGTFEIEIAGRWLTGWAAIQALGLQTPDRAELVDRESLLALRYATGLEVNDAGTLADFLYGFGCLPYSSRWYRLLPGHDEVFEYLGRPAFPGWQMRFPRTGYPWFSWHRSRRDQRAGPIYKLYVSPRPESLSAAFVVLMEVLARSEAFHLKVGGKARSLLRTDKLVIYLDSFEKLAATAALLAPRMAGLPGHPVPFSSRIDEQGLLSWGLDPPRPASPSPRPDRSWRSWITDRIAMAMVEGRRQAVENLVPWVCWRLEMDGLDTTSWTPDPGRWLAVGEEV